MQPGQLQIFTHMIEIDQIAALRAKLFFDLGDDPGRAIADGVNMGVGAEASPHRAGQQLRSRGFDAPADRAGIDRRGAAFGVRQAQLGFAPQQRLALALVPLPRVAFHDRDHAAIGLRDNLLVKTRGLRKFLRRMAGFGGFKHRLRMTERDPLDRALADRNAVVLLQLERHLRKRAIGGKVGDRALQRP